MTPEAPDRILQDVDGSEQVRLACLLGRLTYLAGCKYSVKP